MSNRARGCFKLILVLGFLYLFLVSIGLMGAAFKGFGRDFAENLIRTTSNPFVGLFIGILATSIIQSSSMTTSIVVGMVAYGVITIGNAIPIVMGANIGTTVTNTIVALGYITRREEFRRAFTGSTLHDLFNLIAVAILFPLELLTGFLRHAAEALAGLFSNAGGIKLVSPLKLITQPAIHLVKDLIGKFIYFSSYISSAVTLVIALLSLFFALFFMVRIMRSLVIGRAEVVFNNIIGRNALAGIAVGLIFTAVVQSSSITTSLLVPLMAAGIITVEQLFPLVIGANIGTTVTAILASFATGNILAITVAFVHLLFNITGVLVLYPLRIMRRIPITLARRLGAISARKRRYALIYVGCVFFLIPGLLIFVSRLFMR